MLHEDASHNDGHRLPSVVTRYVVTECYTTHRQLEV